MVISGGLCTVRSVLTVLKTWHVWTSILMVRSVDSGQVRMNVCSIPSGWYPTVDVHVGPVLSLVVEFVFVYINNFNDCILLLSPSQGGIKITLQGLFICWIAWLCRKTFIDRYALHHMWHEEKCINFTFHWNKIINSSN